MDNENITRVKDFQSEVLDRSGGIPVLVDFWAEWCGPCKVLGPVLEKLAGEAAGKWTLATLNTEEFPEISAQYGIRSIPNVKLFVDGRVVDEFAGAMPEYAIRQWLERAVPGPSAAPLAAAREHMALGDLHAAREILRGVLASEPGNPEALVLTARLTVMERPDEALRMIAGIEEPSLSDDIEVVLTVAHLHAVTADPAGVPDAPVKETYLRAASRTLSGEMDAALTDFIEVIRSDRYYDDDGSRRACITIFRMLGEEDPVTLKHRRDFGSALYI